jgi:hypothetical protein
MSEPIAEALATLVELMQQQLAEQRLLRERMDALTGELRGGKRRARKRQRTVALRAVERVESVPVTDLDRMRARKALRKAGML